VGEAPTSAEALGLTTRVQPALMLLDLDVGEAQATAHLPALLEAALAARLVVLTGVQDPEAHRQAVRHRALGLVVQTQEPATLLQALVQVHMGGVWLAPPLVAWALRTLPAPPKAAAITRLTAWEREGIPLIVAGLRNHDIAVRLGIREGTVRHHLTALCAKLGVPGRMALALYACQHGLAKLPCSAGTACCAMHDAGSRGVEPAGC